MDQKGVDMYGPNRSNISTDLKGPLRRRTMKPFSDEGQFKLRLSRDLREWLQAQAQASRRSLTGEIQWRLQKSREQQLAAQQPAK